MHFEEVEDLHQRLAKIASRLEDHNRLEETQAYTWPTLLFDKQEVVRLCDRLRTSSRTCRRALPRLRSEANGNNEMQDRRF